MQDTFCYVTHDGPADGVWNMAVDDGRLSAVVETPEAAVRLRFYQWRTPTLSLGYFQPLAQRQEHKASEACPVVRRASGGGAIVHDRELTYSLVVPAKHRLAKNGLGLYEMLHTTLIAALAELGVEARLSEGQEGKPFLCFSRRTAGDVLVAAGKICGSAQRRRRGAVLQHGSVLLARSMAAPELPGIAELAGPTITAKQLAMTWVGQLKVLHRWDLHLNEPLLEAENPIVQAAIARYTATAWTARR